MNSFLPAPITNKQSSIGPTPRTERSRGRKSPRNRSTFYVSSNDVNPLITEMSIDMDMVQTPKENKPIDSNRGRHQKIDKALPPK